MMLRKLLYSLSFLASFSTLSAVTTDVYETIGQHLLPGVASSETTAHISVYDQYKTALSVLRKEHGDQPTPATISDTTVSDLNLLYYNPITPDFTVLNTVKRTSTILGTCRLAEMLLTPTDDIKTLNHRQMLIQFLIEKDDVRKYLQEQLKAFSDFEPQLLSLLNPDDIIYGESMRSLFFSQGLNHEQSSTRLNVVNRWQEMYEAMSPATGALFIALAGQLPGDSLMDKFIYFVTNIYSQLPQILPKGKPGSEGFLKRNLKKVPWGTIKSGAGKILSPAALVFGYAVSGKTILEKHRIRKHLLKTLKRRFTSLVALSKTMRALGQKNPYYAVCLQIPSLAKLHKASGPEHHDLHSFFARLTKPAFNESRNYFATNIGMVLSALPRFLKLKRKIEPLLYALADIDALVSIATLYKEHQNTKQVYSFARFLHGESAPTLFVDEFWHPNLSPNIAIDNSLFIGGETIKRNIILTGPNAAGKSTISKGLLLSALLGQTLTITPARTLHFTPFARINTSLNIVEDPEKRTSQHRAETRRTAELISEITSLEPGRFSFTIMDEMLRITNPLTGSAAAYGIAKELGKVPNSILVLATHFNNLPRLGEEVESSFENYRVTASEQEDGSFKYPYKIEKGINNNIIALALLANKGFNKDIIATAYDHLAYLGDHNKSNSSMTRMLKDMRDKMATAKKASSH